MRFASLGSGSRGNATLIEQGNSCLLVDCGFSVVQLERRLARLGKSLDDLSAVLITHEHGDHIRGVTALARKTSLPVWMTPGTASKHAGGTIPSLKSLNSHTPFSIGELEVQPFPVPHDAKEPVQFVFSNGQHRLGLLTDVGHITPHIELMLDGCDAMLLECNHDRQMLAESAYPEHLKRRISSDYGHLSNDQSAGLLEKVDCSRLQHVVAAHLSEKNNAPEQVVGALSTVLDCTPDWIGICDQEEGLAWRDIR